MSSVYSRKSARCFGRCGLLSNVSEEGRKGGGVCGPIVALAQKTDKISFSFSFLCVGVVLSCFELFDFFFNAQ